MNSIDRPEAPVTHLEAAVARELRLAREGILIDAAIASAAAGRTVSEEQFDAWIDSIGTANELPPPKPGL